LLCRISEVMAKLIFGLAVVSFFYLKEFRLHLFLLGGRRPSRFFAYGHYLRWGRARHPARYPASAPHFWLWGSFVNPGWLQLNPSRASRCWRWRRWRWGCSTRRQLDRRLIIGVFAVGWIGLVPYSYERFASSTHPPMNWGFASERSGFYYEVSREQYPKSLPTLIKIDVRQGHRRGSQRRPARRDHRPARLFSPPREDLLLLRINLQQNFTVPLIFLTLAIPFISGAATGRRSTGSSSSARPFSSRLHASDHRAAGGFRFRAQSAVQGLSPPIALHFCHPDGLRRAGAMTYLHELMPEVPAQTGVIGFGLPALCLSLLPLWSNFDNCSQAGHWFGYDYGADMMRPMDKNAVYFGGSDPGRFVPTFMAFVESQQDVGKPLEAGARIFDRRDVAVITQNALCDTYYNHYIRDQYDPRFRPTKPVHAL
jgi:hypothetical protein